MLKNQLIDKQGKQNSFFFKNENTHTYITQPRDAIKGDYKKRGRLAVNRHS